MKPKSTAFGEISTRTSHGSWSFSRAATRRSSWRSIRRWFIRLTSPNQLQNKSTVSVSLRSALLMYRILRLLPSRLRQLLGQQHSIGNIAQTLHLLRGQAACVFSQALSYLLFLFRHFYHLALSLHFVVAFCIVNTQYHLSGVLSIHSREIFLSALY